MGRRRSVSKGPRRAYLKKFSAAYVNTGSSVDTIAMHNSAERSADGKEEWFQYGKRARNGVPFMLEGMTLNKFIEENLGKMNVVVFKKTPEQSLQMYFSGSIVFFISTIGKAWKRSVVYTSTDKAKHALRVKGIIWVENGISSGPPPST